MSTNFIIHIPGVGGFSAADVDVITNNIFSLISGCSLDTSGQPIPISVTHCKKCGSKNIRKRGFSGSKQRYQCNICKKCFIETTSEAIYNSSINFDVWLSYIRCFVSGATVRKSAQDCGISTPTSFSLRHKILRAIHADFVTRHPGFKIAISEDFLPVNWKGNHTLNTNFSLGREARKRGPRRNINNLKEKERDICEFICRHYNGVSSKYLDLYVSWFLWLKEFKQLNNKEEE